MSRPVLLRFVARERHPPYGARSGILTIAYRIKRDQTLGKDGMAELTELLSWFEAELRIPDRFNRSRRPHADTTAISWLRAEATEHVSRMRRLASLLDAAGHSVETLRTTSPGYVVFEDEHQVVAHPFSDTPS